MHKKKQKKNKIVPIARISFNSLYIFFLCPSFSLSRFFSFLCYLLQQNDAPRPIRLYSSASAEEPTESSHIFDSTKSTLTAVKPSKPRWSTLFGQKNPHQGQLCEILNQYAKNGVPQSKAFSSFEHSDFVSSLHYLNSIHGSWKEFVNVSNMKEHEIKIQSAIWELVTTEVDYIHALQTVTEVNI